MQLLQNIYCRTLVKTMKNEWLSKILETEITRKKFLVLLGKFLILITLLSYLPLKWIKNNGRPLKMQVKQFKEEGVSKPSRTVGEIPLYMGIPEVTLSMKFPYTGEFSFEIERECMPCYLNKPDDSCEVCRGGVYYLETIVAPWGLCEEIYQAMTEAAIREQAMRNLSKQAQDLNLYK